ncbi:MAG: hypothetical protein HY704_01470 [Gemmatimonadetes bacterium]|nr:hypothetical protein [Gemmatimonadota bacterium]
MTSERARNEQRLCEVMSTAFDAEINGLRDTDSPETISGWDSLSHLSFALAMESAFAIRLTTLEIVEMKDVAAAKAVLRGRGVLI